VEVAPLASIQLSILLSKMVRSPRWMAAPLGYISHRRTDPRPNGLHTERPPSDIRTPSLDAP